MYIYISVSNFCQPRSGNNKQKNRYFYVSLCTCTCVHMCVYTHTCVCVSVCMYVYVYTHTCMCTFTYIHTHVHIHMCTCIHTCTHAHTHTHTYTYTYMCIAFKLYHAQGAHKPTFYDFGDSKVCMYVCVECLRKGRDNPSMEASKTHRKVSLSRQMIILLILLMLETKIRANAANR